MADFARLGLVVAVLAAISDAGMAFGAPPGVRLELVVSNVVVLLAAGAWLGIGSGAVVWFARSAARVLGCPPVVVAGVLSGAVLVPIGGHVFGGPRIAATIWGSLGPVAFPLVGGVGLAASVWAWARLVRWADGAGRGFRVSAAAGALGIAVALMVARLHPLLSQMPVVVAACVAGAFAAALTAARLAWTPSPWRSASAGPVCILVGAGLVLATHAIRPGNAARFQLAAAPYTAAVFAPTLWGLAHGDDSLSPFDSALVPARVPWETFASYGPETPAAADLRRAAAGRNVLFVVVDALRFDRVARAGRFPTVARLWKDSVRFERAIAASPATSASVAGMLQGRSNPSTDHPAVLWTRLATAGYRTAMVATPHALEHVRRRCDLSVVGDVVEVGRPGGAPSLELLEHWGTGLVDQAVDWLDRAPSERFALWVQLFAAHEWYTPYVHRPWKEGLGWGDEHELYDRALAADDRALDRLLSQLRRRGLRDDTIVVLLSDHGEGLGDRGRMNHGVVVDPELIHVPWAIQVPMAPARSVPTFVGLVSLPATLADLLGLPPPEWGEGASLLPLVGRVGAGGAPRPVLVRGSQQDAVLHGDWLLRFDRQVRAAQLIDLEEFHSMTPADHFDSHEVLAFGMFSLLYQGHPRPRKHRLPRN